MDHIFAVFGLKPRHVVLTAGRIAEEMSFRRSISRQYLSKLRGGRARATEEKILLLVMTIRELTGYAVRAGDLFPLEPAFTEGMPLLRPDARSTCLPVSSIPFHGRTFLPEPTGRSGDDAVEALYVEYGVLLRSIAMRRYGVPPDDAEALVHDTFVAYIERHTAIREIKPWLMGAVSNACKHYWRDRKREAPMPELYEETADPASGTEADQWEWRITVSAVVARLGAKCRETIRGYYWREESKETIAETLATSPAYVRQLLVSCRRRLKELLNGTGRGRT
ncbi:MAG: RNA polymerase sigma factor [Thermoanaerobaculia bacterium]